TSKLSDDLVRDLCKQFRSADFRPDLLDCVERLKGDLPKLRESDDARYGKAMAVAAVAHIHFDRGRERREYLAETGAKTDLIKYIRARIRAADFRKDLLQT